MQQPSCKFSMNELRRRNCKLHHGPSFDADGARVCLGKVCVQCYILLSCKFASFGAPIVCQKVLFYLPLFGWLLRSPILDDIYIFFSLRLHVQALQRKTSKHLYYVSLEVYTSCLYFFGNFLVTGYS